MGAVDECVVAILEFAGAGGGRAGCGSTMFYRNRALLRQAYPDFGERLGFDGKKLHTHSTGRIRADGTCSDADADWDRHDYREKDAHGNDWCKTVTWFIWWCRLILAWRRRIPLKPGCVRR